jgi:predicted ATP-dependent protease
VIIPEANVRHLMLSKQVVDAVRAGRFRIWSAGTVDDGIELLTGLTAGRRGPDGRFPEGTVHARVEERLERWERIAREQTGTDGEDSRTAPPAPAPSGSGVRGSY